MDGLSERQGDAALPLGELLEDRPETVAACVES